MNRSISSVIGDILGLLPGEGYEELKSRLIAIRIASGYTAPEMMVGRWAQLCNTTWDTLGPLDDTSPLWQRQIARTLSGSIERC